MSEKTCAPPWQDGGARRPTRWQRSATCVGGRRAHVKGAAGGFEGAGARRERRETQLIFVLRFLLSSLSPTRPRAPLRPRQGPATAQAGAARPRAASGTPAREVDWRSCMHGHAARAKEKGSKRGNSFRSPDSFSQRPPGFRAPEGMRARSGHVAHLLRWSHSRARLRWDREQGGERGWGRCVVWRWKGVCV